MTDVLPSHLRPYTNGNTYRAFKAYLNYVDSVLHKVISDDTGETIPITFERFLLEGLVEFYVDTM